MHFIKNIAQFRSIVYSLIGLFIILPNQYCATINSWLGLSETTSTRNQFVWEGQSIDEIQEDYPHLFMDHHFIMGATPETEDAAFDQTNALNDAITTLYQEIHPQGDPAEIQIYLPDHQDISEFVLHPGLSFNQLNHYGFIQENSEVKTLISIPIEDYIIGYSFFNDPAPIIEEWEADFLSLYEIEADFIEQKHISIPNEIKIKSPFNPSMMSEILTILYPEAECNYHPSEDMFVLHTVCNAHRVFPLVQKLLLYLENRFGYTLTNANPSLNHRQDIPVLQINLTSESSLENDLQGFLEAINRLKERISLVQGYYDIYQTQGIANLERYMDYYFLYEEIQNNLLLTALFESFPFYRSLISSELPMNEIQELVYTRILSNKRFVLVCTNFQNYERDLIIQSLQNANQLLSSLHLDFFDSSENLVQLSQLEAEQILSQTESKIMITYDVSVEPGNIFAGKYIYKSSYNMKIINDEGETLSQLTTTYHGNGTTQEDAYRDSIEHGLSAALKKVVSNTVAYYQIRQQAIEVAQINIIPSLFPSLYESYKNMEEGIGNIHLINRSNEESTIQIVISIPGLMDSTYLTDVPMKLPAGEEINFPLKLNFSQEFLSSSVSSSRIVQIKLIIQKNEQRPQEILLSKPVYVYSKNAITWDDPYKVSVFVNPQDPAISQIRPQMEHHLTMASLTYLPSKVLKAMQAYYTLRSLELQYQSDPNNPFSSEGDGSIAVDSIQFPSEFICETQTGDCDDCTILLTSLLESIGIQTAFLLLPDHIFMMFNTGIRQTNWRSVHNNQNKIILYDNMVWVPMETTLLDIDNGGGFIEAWDKAAQEYYSNLDTIEVIDIALSRRVYTPVSLSSLPAPIPSIEWNESQIQYENTIDQLYHILYTVPKENLLSQLENQPDNGDLRRQLAVLYVKFEEYQNTIDLLTEIQDDGDKDFIDNYYIGLSHYKLNQYDEAVKYFTLSLESVPENLLRRYSAKISIQLSLCYQEMQDFSHRDEYYELAYSINPGVADQFAVQLEQIQNIQIENVAEAEEQRMDILYLE